MKYTSPSSNDAREAVYALRRTWPVVSPPPTVRSQALMLGLHALHGARHSRAKAAARRLCLWLYVCVATLTGAAFVALSGAFAESFTISQRAGAVCLLGLVALGSGVAALIQAARWSRETRGPAALPAALWAPGIGLAGAAIVVVAAVSMLLAPADRPRAMLAGADQSALDLVSMALTHTTTVSDAQTWLNAQLPDDIERAWFVTSEGLIALSSITRANEISRSVLDFVLAAQVQVPLTQAAAIGAVGIAGGLDSPEEWADAGLGLSSMYTTATVQNQAPLVLLALVKEALRIAAADAPDVRVAARPVATADGSLAGVSAVAVRAPAGARLTVQVGAMLLGSILLCSGWAVWVYALERKRRHATRDRLARPVRWAGLVALLLPMGIALYLNQRGDDAQ